MKNNNYSDREVHILNEADYKYLSADNYQSDHKLVRLFKSKSPWQKKVVLQKIEAVM